MLSQWMSIEDVRVIHVDTTQVKWCKWVTKPWNGFESCVSIDSDKTTSSYHFLYPLTWKGYHRNSWDIFPKRARLSKSMSLYQAIQSFLSNLTPYNSSIFSAWVTLTKSMTNKFFKCLTTERGSFFLPGAGKN